MVLGSGFRILSLGLRVWESECFGISRRAKFFWDSHGLYGGYMGYIGFMSEDFGDRNRPQKTT